MRQKSKSDTSLCGGSSPFGLRGLATLVALFGLLASAGCMGLTGKSNVGSPSVADAAVAVNPSPIGFGNVVVGTMNSQTISVSNAATTDLTITSVKISGAGFDISGPPTPFTLVVGQGTTFAVSFHPTSAGATSGHISIASGTSHSDKPFGLGSPTAVNLTGTGVAATLQLSANTSSLSFGNVTVGASSSQSVLLKNTGNSNVTISSASASGTGFAASGGSNTILDPNQSVSVTVSFNPQAAGAATGTLSVSSNASNALLQIPLSGGGVSKPVQTQPAVPDSVALSWNPSVSAVVGYFVYRGTTAGGPYSKLNSSFDGSTSYTDGSVSSGQTYFYVVTSVDSSNIESGYSNQVSVTIPSS
jgi:hypothetical protein